MGDSRKPRSLTGRSERSRIKDVYSCSSSRRLFRPSKGQTVKRRSDCGTKENGVMPDISLTPTNKELLKMMKKRDSLAPVAKEFVDFIRAGDHKNVKRMIKERVVDVNLRDTEDPVLPTPLLIAAEMNDEEMVRLLMKAKPYPASVNDETTKGKRAIWLAAKNGNVKMVEYLLNGKTPCEVNIVDKESGCSPLFRAVLTESKEICQMLIKVGGDVNLRRLSLENSNETPLIKAIQMDNRDICQILINSLCKLQTKTDAGLNALHFAVAYCRYDIAELLMENGAKIHAKSNAGVTAMSVAIENHNAAMVRILLTNGYKVDKKYKWKETPLQQAIKLHATESALTLIRHGCTVKKDKGSSYMFMAVEEKLVRIIKFLIALNPLSLNEEWLQKQMWPVSIYRRPDIFNWLQREASTPRTLKQLCRARIFKLLGTHAPSKAKELPLPEPLQDYLQYNEFVKEEYYQRKPLNSKECPFDCPPKCSYRHCPPIEVSASESEAESDSDVEIDSSQRSVQS
ncbi:delta-latroinsectotoxin-Lt1a-like isoform X2 [Argopecten irradians]|uniref:delta-latroinsectotoxin-Lt1a-like isoform X2 n=1 Tax=Argopecten irradians TaxID=31199 RepID=UPI00371E1DB7